MKKNKPTYKELESRIIELDEEIEKMKKIDENISLCKMLETKKPGDEKKESEKLFKMLFNNMAQGVVFKNTKGEIIMANPSAEDILGVDFTQMKGRTFNDNRWQTIHEDGSEFPGSTYPSMVSLKTGKKVKDIVMGVYHPKKNDYVWININARPLIKPGAKKPFMVFTTFEDITVNKKTEKALYESEDRYNSFIELAPYGILVHDEQERILIFNKKLEIITGYSRDEMPDLKIWFKKIYPDDKYRILVTNKRKKVDLEEKQYIIEATITCKDGKKRMCQFVSSKSSAGIRTVFINDITERKTTEEALKESEERFRSVIEQAAEGIILHDLKGQILMVNNMICKLTGYSKEEFLRMNISDFDRNVIEKEHRKKCSESLDFGKYLKFETVNSRKDKTIYPAEVHIVKIRLKEQPVILGFTSDITERKKYETQLQKAKEKAEESDQLKSAFLANMSHEIRTPLNGILGFADMLKNSEISETKRKHFIDIIQEGGQHLLQIVNDIIDISKIEARQIEVTESETCINDMLIELFSFYEPIVRKSSINLYLQKTLSDSRSKVYTDKAKLKQILQNLLSNALKFTHKGYIKFGYILKKNLLEFYIEDTGIGIPADLHKTIFERFRQGDSGPGRQYGGTGLGLSIAKAFVQKLGGEIWMSSIPGKGSKFFFTIPYKPVQKIKPKQSRKGKYDKDAKLLTILVVEDDDVNFLYLEEILADMNAKILHAKNAYEAIKLSGKHPEINLVLMDIKLPDMDGYKATKKIKQINPDLPVIAQTAYALEGDRDKALECGCDEYIAKPIKHKKLVDLVLKFSRK